MQVHRAVRRGGLPTISSQPERESRRRHGRISGRTYWSRRMTWCVLTTGGEQRPCGMLRKVPYGSSRLQCLMWRRVKGSHLEFLQCHD